MGAMWLFVDEYYKEKPEYIVVECLKFGHC